MKKPLLLSALFIILISCSSRSDDTSPTPTPTPPTSTIATYNKDVSPIIQGACVSCHAAGGTKADFPLTSYALVKAAVDNIIVRIEKPAGDPLKMPKGGSLSASDIALIKKWKADGLLEQ